MNKKKIALMVDRDDWAFANIAKNITKNLSDKYDFKIIPLFYFNNNLIKGYIAAKDCDLIHFFWRKNLIDLKGENYEWYARQLGYSSLDAFKEEYVNHKILTTCVYDHIQKEDGINFTKELFDNYEHYYVSSNILNNIYQNMDVKYKPKCVITDGVDLKEFYPINLERFKTIKNRNLIIGWVGNSEWKNDVEDFKGVNTILKPAIEDLKKEGYKVENYFADRKERMIPHDQMVDYYSKIDVLICASKCEGTPNPVLEAMACGVPIISTNVGIVSEALGKKQQEYILEERTKECMKEKIIKLIHEKDKIIELSNENLNQIGSWEWKIITQKFDSFFEDVLKEP